MKKLLIGLGISTLISLTGIANANPSAPKAPQPTACITSQFSSSGDQYWKNIILKLTNNCETTVDFQNTTVTFLNSIPLNTNFWGDFAPLSYPDNDLKITSQVQPDNNYLASLHLHFPTYSGSNSKLPAGKSIAIKYGAKSEGHLEGSTQVYLGTPVETGNIELTNTSAKPANVSQSYALIHVSWNGERISDVQLPWGGIQTISGLAPGNYTIAAESLDDSNGNTYQGIVTPASITLTANQTANASVAYSLVQQTGKVTVSLQALPQALTGYTEHPVVLVTQTGTGNSTSASLTFGTSTTVTQLKNGNTYGFSTPAINFNSHQCQPTFTPETLIASETPPTTSLTYLCQQVAQARVTLNVSGAPSSLTSLRVSLAPNNNTQVVSQMVPLSNGSGSETVLLTNGVTYNLSADPVSNYNINFNPQPLTASENAVETITLSPVGTTPVAINGQLKVCGTKLCNEHDVPIQLKGMSSHGLQWFGLNNCLTQASMNALANDFKANVMRISLYVQEGGYETDPVKFTNEVNQLIQEASARGIYAIVDWHMLSPGDPNYNFMRAQKFFTDIATANKNRNNLIYEIANEPNGVNWATIKSYADRLIPIIRAIDPKTVILIGTPGWSSLGISDGRNSQDIINNPVNFTNVMYTFHFYAASHKDVYYNELDRASNVLPIFVTEFGTQTFTGDGANDFVMSDRYIQLMNQKKISWTNWNFSDDFRSGAIWKQGTCSQGPWTDANLKPAGVWVKDKIKN